MGNFNRDNKSGRRGSNRDYNRRDSNRPSMHHAVCDKCGKDCEVPFRPTGDKPVFCNDCFKNIEPKRAGQGDFRKPGGRDFKRASFGDKKMYKAICDKCQKECEVPFRPTGGKPIFCNDCFVKDPSASSGQGEKVGAKDSNQLNEQLAKINTKLDEILKTLASGAVKAKPKKKETPTKEKAAKPKKPAAKKKTAKKK